jgi:hypothetical protein
MLVFWRQHKPWNFGVLVTARAEALMNELKTTMTRGRKLKKVEVATVKNIMNLRGAALV